jgi:hypothetical protein
MFTTPLQDSMITVIEGGSAASYLLAADFGVPRASRESAHHAHGHGRAQDDFLTVVRAIAPEWAGASHHDLIMKETTGKTEEIQPLADYIAQFRMYH